MASDDLVRYTSDALLLCLLVSLPAVLTAAFSGLIIAFFQAVLSLQDSSISFTLKLIIIVVVLLIAAPWGAATILEFAKTMMRVAFP